MALLIDTSVLIDAERRNRSLSSNLGDDDRAISVIAASELLHGVDRAKDGKARTHRAAFVEGLLSAFEVLRSRWQLLACMRRFGPHARTTVI